MSILLAAAHALAILLGSGDSDALRQTAPSYLTPETAREHLAAATLAGAAYDVDPALLLAIAWHESRYDSNARTREPGARWSCGAMTPEPHAEECRSLELTTLGSYLIGAHHLRVWVDQCGGDVTCGLRAYAGGGALAATCARDGHRTNGSGVDLCDVDGMFANRARWIRARINKETT